MNKLFFWVKSHKAITVLAVAILLPLIIIYKPYKPTNPSNPLFVESWFRLNDYGLFRFDALKHALKVLFPVGTPKEYVDKMLVEYGGAERTDQARYDREKNWFVYWYKPFYLKLTPDQLMVDVYYDENDKVKILMLNRGLINGVWIPEEHETTSDKLHKEMMEKEFKRLRNNNVTDPGESSNE